MILAFILSGIFIAALWTPLIAAAALLWRWKDSKFNLWFGIFCLVVFGFEVYFWGDLLIAPFR